MFCPDCLRKFQKNFSAKSEALRREKPLTQLIIFVGLKFLCCSLLSDEKKKQFLIYSIKRKKKKNKQIYMHPRVGVGLFHRKSPEGCIE